MYNSLIWGEEVQNNGLAGVVALAPTDHTLSGDTILLKKGMGRPVVYGLGSTADTKPQGCQLVPSQSNRGVGYDGPGHIHFHESGYADLRPIGGILFDEGETITGRGSNTNVNEGIVVLAQLGYGAYPPNWTIATRRQKKIFIEPYTITPAAAVTYNSGAAAINAATTSGTWMDPDKNYELLGIMPCVSAATAQGVMNVGSLSGVWHGWSPGIAIGGLSAVDFSPGGPSWAPEPIPFTGASPCTLGMTACSAVAITGGLIIAEL